MKHFWQVLLVSTKAVHWLYIVVFLLISILVILQFVVNMANAMGGKKTGEISLPLIAILAGTCLITAVLNLIFKNCPLSILEEWIEVKAGKKCSITYKDSVLYKLVFNPLSRLWSLIKARKQQEE